MPLALPGRNYVSAYGVYKHGYQGEYAEQDENGYTNFQLRQFDTRLGHWLVPDPMGQYVSAYLGMGNNPTLRVDPSGGYDGTENFEDTSPPLSIYELESMYNRFGSATSWFLSSDGYNIKPYMATAMYNADNRLAEIEKSLEKAGHFHNRYTVQVISNIYCLVESNTSSDIFSGRTLNDIDLT